MNIRRGQIWLADLSPTVGTEQRGTRPVVIISSDRFARMPIAQAIVVPVTSRDRQLPHHVRVDDDSGLSRPSWAMTEGVRAVSTHRFRHRIGTASDTTTAAIIDRVRFWLD